MTQMNDNVCPLYSTAMAELVEVLDISDPRDAGPIDSIVILINHYEGEDDFTPHELAGQFAWHIAQDIGRDHDEGFIGKQLDALSEKGASFNLTMALDHALLLGQRYL